MFINPTFYAISHSAIENVGSAGDYINEVVMISLAHPKTQWPLKVRTAGPSTALRSGREDKGRVLRLRRIGCRTRGCTSMHFVKHRRMRGKRTRKRTGRAQFLARP